MTKAWTRASTTSSSAPTRVKHRYAIRSERVQLRDSSPRSLPSSAAVDILTSSTSDEGEEVAWGEMNEISAPLASKYRGLKCLKRVLSHIWWRWPTVLGLLQSKRVRANASRRVRDMFRSFHL